MDTTAPRSRRRSRADHPIDREVAAAHIRERIYVSFTSLAVLLTLLAHTEHLSAGSAAASLAISGLGTVVAAYAADLISHAVVHGARPEGEERRGMIRASIGALGVIGLPELALALSALGLWEVTTALRVGVGILVGTLGLVGWMRVRRTALPVRDKARLLIGLVGLGVLVVFLKLLAGH